MIGRYGHRDLCYIAVLFSNIYRLLIIHLKLNDHFMKNVNNYTSYNNVIKTKKLITLKKKNSILFNY